MSTDTHEQSIQERVNAICNELYAEGVKPSVRRVLAQLPDVRSTSTVHKYFATWRKEIDANQQSLYDRLGFSSEFTQAFLKEITRFGVEAEQRYKAQAQDANEQRDQALEDLTKIEGQQFKQASLVEQLQEEVSELQRELTEVSRQAKANLAQQEALAQSTLEKEQKANEARVAELRHQLTDTGAEKQALAESCETLRSELAKAQLRLESNDQVVSEVKTQNQELVRENKKLNQAVTELSKVQATQSVLIDGHEKLIDSQNQQIRTSGQQYDHLQQQHDKQTKALEEARRHLQELHVKSTDEAERLAEQIQKSAEQKAQFEEQLRAHEQTIRTQDAAIASNQKLIERLEISPKTESDGHPEKSV